jgi:hypothetical protein
MEKTKIFVELFIRYKMLSSELRESVGQLVDCINDPMTSADERFAALATISDALECE